MAKTLNRIGEVYKNNDGLEMLIVEYINNKYVTVKFRSGYTKTTNMSTIQRGQVKDNFIAEAKRELIEQQRLDRQLLKKQKAIDKIAKQKDVEAEQQLQKKLKVEQPPKKWYKINVYDVTVAGVGYIGHVDKTLSYYDKARKLWAEMLRRCYSGTSSRSDNSFLYVLVCKRWHSLENFANDLPSIIGFDLWVAGKNMQLDKDLLSDQRIYAPETCIFLEASINNQLQNKSKLLLARKRIAQGLVDYIPAERLHAVHQTRKWVEFLQSENANGH